MSAREYLTADEVRDVVFDHAGPFRRGYDESQVDEFLELVERSIVTLVDIVDQKQLELDSVNFADETWSATGRSQRPAAFDVETSGRIIAEAEQRANAILNNAHLEAQRIEDDARAQAHRIVAEAGRRVGLAAGPQSSHLTAEARSLAATTAEIGARLADVRDALSVEVTNLYAVIGKIHNNRP